MANSDWNEVNVFAELSVQGQFLYTEMKTAYRQYAERKATFENYMQSTFGERLPEGQELKFGYNFGKLSVAIVDDDRKPAKTMPAKQSLADFIAAQQAAGRRS